ncbi:uncharacterized protein LOC119997861 [Tripterygium wilfordii]|uniref:uncharacterized protein LOC119997861 n=1 Tax=Tripterygium wilfordii TaxID=458696 RepID=UPI0018F7EC3D|nr:uncharacterized protein LOC119997861 [Tripterygium wilfordii]XP_038701002.1 uncharacterized protein LOC119997861 [Tripterygium wilfordii]XP_038701004.1 uncharacterized protein LOC119997861 [Tripterygium wilfordii]XP_038701005.1 uncharacterized protein LOC119997861 [Tripterygium wilfordii]XP_038701006.1 uncharacterized protein LOC119997861 [Tripterygium wilfordii]
MNVHCAVLRIWDSFAPLHPKNQQERVTILLVMLHVLRIARDPFPSIWILAQHGTYIVHESYEWTVERWRVMETVVVGVVGSKGGFIIATTVLHNRNNNGIRGRLHEDIYTRQLSDFIQNQMISLVPRSPEMKSS